MPDRAVLPTLRRMHGPIQLSGLLRGPRHSVRRERLVPGVAGMLRGQLRRGHLRHGGGLLFEHRRDRIRVQRVRQPVLFVRRNVHWRRQRRGAGPVFVVPLRSGWLPGSRHRGVGAELSRVQQRQLRRRMRRHRHPRRRCDRVHAASQRRRGRRGHGTSTCPSSEPADGHDVQLLIPWTPNPRCPWAPNPRCTRRPKPRPWGLDAGRSMFCHRAVSPPPRIRTVDARTELMLARSSS